VEIFEIHSQVQKIDSSDSEPSTYNVVDVEDLTTSSKPQTNNLDIGHCSREKAESYCVTNASSYNSEDDQGLCENNTKDKDVSSTLSTPQYSLGDCLPSETSRRSPSSSSDEENFLFSDLDENRMNDRYEGSLTPEYIDKDDSLSYEDGTETSRVTSCPIVIPRNEVAAGEVGQHTGSLPNISSGNNSMRQHVRFPLSQSLDSTFPGKDDLKCLNLDEYKEKQLPHEQEGGKAYQDSEEVKDTTLNLPPGKRAGINYHCNVSFVFSQLNW